MYYYSRKYNLSKTPVVAALQRQICSYINMCSYNYVNQYWKKRQLKVIHPIKLCSPNCNQTCFWMNCHIAIRLPFGILCSDKYFFIFLDFFVKAPAFIPIKYVCELLHYLPVGNSRKKCWATKSDISTQTPMNKKRA